MSEGIVDSGNVLAARLRARFADGAVLVAEPRGEVTLEQLLATWTVHDLTHIRQIVMILASKYAENVGAWKQYLSILQ